MSTDRCLDPWGDIDGVQARSWRVTVGDQWAWVIRHERGSGFLVRTPSSAIGLTVFDSFDAAVRAAADLCRKQASLDRLAVEQQSLRDLWVTAADDEVAS